MMIVVESMSNGALDSFLRVSLHTVSLNISRFATATNCFVFLHITVSYNILESVLFSIQSINKDCVNNLLFTWLAVVSPEGNCP